jgi:hypothetical protein
MGAGKRTGGEECPGWLRRRRGLRDHELYTGTTPWSAWTSRFSLSVRARRLRNVSAERCFCAQDLDRKDTPQHRHEIRNNQITYALVSD